MSILTAPIQPHKMTKLISSQSHRKNVLLYIFIVLFQLSLVPLNAMEDTIKPKKPSFSSIPTDKAEAEKIIVPLLEENLEASNAGHTLFQDAFDPRNLRLTARITLESWNALIDQVFEKKPEEQVFSINQFNWQYIGRILDREEREAK